ncbi:MAG: glycosyltransferase family 39 protein [bacterium]|nr:glycosyltransferase family 39 protein [bacterium]MDD5354223.1 glycosyltransferase family 39 protein [bacterium]MDD5757270.1 glycosyltransferase family 39 protein [bacterium]
MLNLEKKNIFNFLLVVLAGAWFFYIVRSFYQLSDLTSVYQFSNEALVLSALWKHPTVFLGYASSFFYLAVILICSMVTGTFLLAQIRIAAQAVLERVVISCGLGLAALSYLMFALGMIGWLNPVFIKVLLLLWFVLCSWYYWPQLKSWKIISFSSILPSSLAAKIALVLIGIAAIVNLFGVLAPEIYYDAMVYHLALPNMYIYNGRIINFPPLGFSYFPQNMEMLYTLSLLVSGDLLARLLHFSAGLGCVLVIFVLGRKYFSRSVAWLSSAIFYLMPLVALESWAALNDLGLSFYVLLTILCVINWLKKGSTSEFFLAAAFCGFALGIKYVSVPVLIGALLIIGYVQAKKKLPWRQVVVPGFIFIAIVFLLVSPWLLKNTLTAGSPLAPFYTGKNSIDLDWRGSIYERECEKPGQTSLTIWPTEILRRWQSVFQENSQNSFIGPLFLFSLPFILISLIRSRGDPVVIALAVFLGVYIFVWWTQTEIMRFLLPIFPLAGLLLSSLAYSQKVIRYQRILLQITVLIILFCNLGMTLSALVLKQPFAVVAGEETKTDYLSRNHPWYPAPSYPAIEYINKNLGQDSKILFIGEERSYYAQRQVIANSAFDVPTFQKYFKSAKTAAELVTRLRQDGINYILLNEKELRRLQIQYKIYDFSSRDLQLLSEFWSKHSRKLYYKDDVGIYQVI